MVRPPVFGRGPFLWERGLEPPHLAKVTFSDQIRPGVSIRTK